MPNLTAIIVKPEWYPELRYGLEEVQRRTTRKPIKDLARSTLRTLETGKKKFDEGRWEQLVFTYKEAKFLSILSETVGLEDAAKRFGATPTRV